MKHAPNTVVIVTKNTKNGRVCIHHDKKLIFSILTPENITQKGFRITSTRKAGDTEISYYVRQDSVSY